MRGKIKKAEIRTFDIVNGSNHDVAFQSGVDVTDFIFRNRTADQGPGVGVDHEAGDAAEKTADENGPDGVRDVRAEVQGQAHWAGGDDDAQNSREVFEQDDVDAGIVSARHVFDETHVGCLRALSETNFNAWPSKNYKSKKYSLNIFESNSN